MNDLSVSTARAKWASVDGGCRLGVIYHASLSPVTERRPPGKPWKDQGRGKPGLTPPTVGAFPPLPPLYVTSFFLLCLSLLASFSYPYSIKICLELLDIGGRKSKWLYLQECVSNTDILGGFCPCIAVSFLFLPSHMCPCVCVCVRVYLHVWYLHVCSGQRLMLGVFFTLDHIYFLKRLKLTLINFMSMFACLSICMHNVMVCKCLTRRVALLGGVALLE